MTVKDIMTLLESPDRVRVIKDGEDQLGTRTKVKVVKNKVAPPFKKAEFDILFGEGISKLGEIIDLGVDYGIIKKAGSWFSYGDRKIGQGRDAVKELLSRDEALRDEIDPTIAAISSILILASLILVVIAGRNKQ